MKHTILLALMLTACGPKWPGGAHSPATVQLEPWRVCCGGPITLVTDDPQITASHMEAAWWAAAIWEKSLGYDGLFDPNATGCEVSIHAASMGPGMIAYAGVWYACGCVLDSYITIDTQATATMTVPYLTSIYVHELGHILGLSDHQDPNGIMLYRTTGNRHPRVPADYEVELVREMYNLPQGQVGPEVRDKAAASGYPSTPATVP